MRQLVTFPDAEAVVLTYLKTAWQNRSEEFRPTTSTNAFPRSAPTGLSTHMQVELDGTPAVEHPVMQRATVRVTLWAAPGKPDSAKAAQALTQALLAIHPGSSQVGAVKVLTGPLKGVDPSSKYPFVSFTARVTLRPTAL